MAAAAGGLRQFLRWWRDELRGLLPQRMREASAARILLAIGQDGYRVFASTGGKLRPVRGEEDLSALEAASAAGELARSNPAALVGVRMPLANCFVRHLELPRSASQDAARILDLDLERATPFKLKDVYSAALVEAGDTRGPRVRVRHLTIKRQAVDPLLEELKASGAAASFIDCWDEARGQPLAVNFLAAQQQAGAGPGRRLSLPSLLLALAAVLGLSAILLAHGRYQMALETVQGQVATTRAQATSVRRAFDTSEAALTEIGQLQSLKLATPPSVEVIDALTKLLPDTVWLTDLKLENGFLDIAGLATSGAALLALFEHSALFADATMASGVNFDPQEKKERFSLRVRLRQPGSNAGRGDGQEKQ
jgi:general secretion pathway protein L